MFLTGENTTGKGLKINHFIDQVKEVIISCLLSKSNI